MEWKELNQSNIEHVKDLYENYLKRHNQNWYSATKRPFTFEEYINNDVRKCRSCSEWNDTYFLEDRDGWICESCR